MPYSIIVRDQKSHFSASHFLFDHFKCSRLHGHNYKVTLYVKGPLNPHKHYVIDFYDIKHSLREITDRLDHRVLIPERSSEIKFKTKGDQIEVDVKNKHFEFPKEDVCFLPIEATTAELIAKFIHDELKKQYQEYNMAVEVAESDSSIARYEE